MNTDRLDHSEKEQNIKGTMDGMFPTMEGGKNALTIPGGSEKIILE